jgi:hypothetical protein
MKFFSPLTGEKNLSRLLTFSLHIKLIGMDALHPPDCPATYLQP